ncbi:MFS transporter [Geodermatophilus poikilotrophus]|uniref:MFS transporter n=1 Tax=Geodermatophilus poikilotrophus TaxID=1333667 RepID=UPI001FE172A4|nr:MFS transporter [Geodermatophilus poikilotrophus]
MTYGLARYGYGLYLPDFRAAFPLSTTGAGVVASGSFLAYCGTAALAGHLVVRGRARRALWLAGGSAALGSAVVATAWSWQVLAVGVLVAGSGAGFATPALVAAVAATVPAEGEPQAQGVVNSGTGAGIVLGGLVVLAAPGTWREVWAGFAVVALLATWWADRCTAWPPGPHRPAPGPGGVRVLALRRPLAAAAVAGVGSASVWTFGRDLLTEAGLSSAVTGLLWCLLGAAGLVGGLSGHLVDRFGVRVAWPVSVGLCAAAVVLLAAAPGSLPASAVSLTCFGAGFVALTGVLIAWGAGTAPHAAGQAAAVVFIGLTAGQACGAVLLGALAGTTGVPVAFVVAAGLLGLAATATSGGAPAVHVGEQVPPRPSRSHRTPRDAAGRRARDCTP